MRICKPLPDLKQRLIDFDRGPAYHLDRECEDGQARLGRRRLPKTFFSSPNSDRSEFFFEQNRQGCITLPVLLSYFSALKPKNSPLQDGGDVDGLRQRHVRPPHAAVASAVIFGVFF
jgi:hypothetical protein